MFRGWLKICAFPNKLLKHLFSGKTDNLVILSILNFLAALEG